MSIAIAPSDLARSDLARSDLSQTDLAQSSLEPQALDRPSLDPLSREPRAESPASTRPRVALVSDYSLATLGGAETAFAEQAKALAQVGDVLVICPGSEALSALGKTPRIRVEPVPVSFVVPGLGFPVARNTARLRSHIRWALVRARVDVLHVHSEFGIAAAAIEAARTMGIPVVHTVHTFFWQTTSPIQTLLAACGPGYYRAMTGLQAPDLILADRPGDSTLRNMTLAVAREADWVISPSSHQADRLREVGLGRVEVIPNTVGWSAGATPLTSIDGPLRVLWLGRFAAEKRVLPFLRSALTAIEHVGADKFRVDLVGTGPQFKTATRMVDWHPGIRLHGRVPNVEMPKWLERSHVTVLSSIGWDNQPMSVAESMMAQRGVIYSDPDLIEGLSEAGIGVFTDDEDEFAARLSALALNPEPVIEASRSAGRARRVFSEQEFLRSAMGVYGRVLTTVSA